MNVKQLLATILSGLVKVAVIIWLIYFVYGKAIAAYEFGYRVFTEPAISSEPGHEVTISVTEGKSSRDIAAILEEKGLVRDKNLAFVQILCSEYRTTIKPGVYTLSTSMTIEEMLKLMSPLDEEEDS